MLAYGIVVTFRRIKAADAKTFGIVHVYRLHAGTDTADAAQMTGMVEEVAVDINLTPHH